MHTPLKAPSPGTDRWNHLTDKIAKLGPAESDAGADQADQKDDDSCDSSGDDFFTMPKGNARPAPASPTETIASVRSAVTAATSVRSAGNWSTGSGNASTGSGTGTGTPGGNTRSGPLPGDVPTRSDAGLPKAKAKGKAKAKAKAKGTGGDKITDYQTALGRQRAHREMQQCDKVINETTLLNKHINSAMVMETKPADVRRTLGKLAQRLEMDVRWVYMGEDLAMNDDSGKKLRNEALEKLKEEKKPLEFSVEVLECAAATQAKDPSKFSHEAFRMRLDACAENNVGIGVPILLKFKQRESQQLLKHELKIFEDACLSEARRVSVAAKARTHTSVPAVNFSKWAISISMCEG